MKLKDLLPNNSLSLAEAKNVKTLSSNYDKALKKEQQLSSLLLVNLEKYKAAKSKGDEKAIAKHTKIAGDLGKKKKRASADANKAYDALDNSIISLHSDAELELNERPITRSRVDYSTMELKSNIATKWLTTDDMLSDLTQWVGAVAAASGTGLGRELGMQLKALGINIIKGQDVGGEDRPAGAATKFD
jgi:hypothetical protein